MIILIYQRIILATLDEFNSSLDPDVEIKGKQFEKFVKWLLQLDPRWNNLLKKIWLCDEHTKRDKWGPDCVIDLVFEDLIGNIWAVQEKCFGKNLD